MFEDGGIKYLYIMALNVLPFQGRCHDVINVLTN